MITGILISIVIVAAYGTGYFFGYNSGKTCGYADATEVANIIYDDDDGEASIVKNNVLEFNQSKRKSKLEEVPWSE